MQQSSSLIIMVMYTLLDSFWEWVEKQNPLGGSKFSKSVNYALNHRETLCNYMKDGRCEISNNVAERRAIGTVRGHAHVDLGRRQQARASILGAGAHPLVIARAVALLVVSRRQRIQRPERR